MNAPHDSHINPFVAVALNTAAVLFAKIDGGSVLMALQGFSLVIAIVVGMVTLYEKLIKPRDGNKS